MKKLTVVLMLIIAAATMNAQDQKTLHDFKTTDIYGDTFDFADLKGKKVLVVNTASKCGLTPQFEDLQALYEEYGGDDFEIVGFPANNFNNQEPGTEEDIIEFCTANYGVTFPMMTKISVKGNDIDPIYEWLTKKSLNGKLDAEIEWNFQKFMIDENGHLVDYASPKVNPRSEEIVGWVSENQ